MIKFPISAVAGLEGFALTTWPTLGLALASRLRDADYAKVVQLLAEYYPEPPFNAGTPQLAGVETTEMMAAMFVPMIDSIKAIAGARRRP